MGILDIVLKANYSIQYPIKGVMFCTMEWPESGGLFEQQLPPGNCECFVFQDAPGYYYFYYQFSQGGDEYLAKFRAPRNDQRLLEASFSGCGEGGGYGSGIVRTKPLLWHTAGGAEGARYAA
jgi:hypothetical protein